MITAKTPKLTEFFERNATTGEATLRPKWDWVGAPWTHNGRGGNGGFSLRSKQAMLDALKTTKYPSGPCDTFYSTNVKNVAPQAVKRRFSVEQIFNTNPYLFYS